MENSNNKSFKYENKQNVNKLKENCEKISEKMKKMKNMNENINNTMTSKTHKNKNEVKFTCCSKN